MYRFNDKAFDMLMAALGIKKYKDFVQFMGTIEIVISENAFKDWRTKGVVSVGVLQQLCNTVHFPISLFFTVDGMEDDREYKIVDADKWRDVYLRPKAMIDATRNRSTYIERVKGMKMGRSYSVLKNNDVEKLKKMSSRRLVEIANNSKVYLGDVINDENLPFLVVPGMKSANTESVERMLRNERAHNVAMERKNENMLEENKLLRSEVDALMGTIAELSEEYEVMREEMKNKNVTIATLRNYCVEMMNKLQDLEKELKAEKKKCRRREKYDRNNVKPEPEK